MVVSLLDFHLAQPMPQERRLVGMTESGSVNMPAPGAFEGFVLLQDQMHEPDDYSLAVKPPNPQPSVLSVAERRLFWCFLYMRYVF